MANTLWSKGRERFLKNTTGATGWDSDNDIRVMLTKSTYTFADSDEFLSNVGAGNDNGRSASLTSLTNTDGIADAADITLTATAAVACNALILFRHTGADATAPLIGYIDTGTGLPLTPGAGATVSITWSSGANKIFKL